MKFSRSVDEGKTCPECGCIHYGSRYCPYSDEGWLDSDERLIAKQKLLAKPKAVNERAEIKSTEKDPQ
jgi:hypothetical protein